MGAAEKQEDAMLVTLKRSDLEALMESAVERAVARAMAATANTQEAKPLSKSEAAAYLGISEDALQQHVTRGNIEPVHRGSRGGGMRGHRFSREDLEAFVNRGKKRSSTSGIKKA